MTALAPPRAAKTIRPHDSHALARMLDDLAAAGPDRPAVARQVLTDLGAAAVPALLAVAAIPGRRPVRAAVKSVLAALGDVVAPEALAAAADPATVRLVGELADALRPNTTDLSDDARLLGWFGSVAPGDYLHRLQAFWCVGWLDRAAVEAAGPALGGGRLTKAFRRHRPHVKGVPLKAGPHYLLDSVEAVDALFDRPPFYPDAWPDEERPLPLKAPGGAGKRPGQRWTRKAARAWAYADRYLALIDATPEWTTVPSLDLPSPPALVFHGTRVDPPAAPPVG